MPAAFARPMGAPSRRARERERKRNPNLIFANAFTFVLIPPFLSVG